MNEILFDTTQEIIKNVEDNSSYRFKEEKNNTVIFNTKRGDMRVIEYEIVNGKIKVNKDEKIIKSLSLSNL